MKQMSNEEILLSRKSAVEQRLNELLPESKAPQKRLVEAMRYSLHAGGKRIRPVLTMEFCAACGEKPETALDFAAAVEMLHTYSLIHDDLPCMDNDDLRRGIPTSHKVFGEWLALLAGDALHSQAFSAVAESGLEVYKIAEAAKVLAFAAGHRGICGGQLLDLDGEGKRLTEGEIYTVHSMKTAALIEAACELGCIAAGANESERAAGKNYGQFLGLAFQIRDDILDVEGSAQSLGKSAGKDAESEKSTFVSLYGVERCREMVRDNTERAVESVSEVLESADFLIWLARKLAERNN